MPKYTRSKDLTSSQILLHVYTGEYEKREGNMIDVHGDGTLFVNPRHVTSINGTPVEGLPAGGPGI